MSESPNAQEPASLAGSAMTPMLRQYFSMMGQVPGAILFFRMGDFYEVFGESAVRIAPVLDIVLTSRESGDASSRMPFCGVPHHSARPYWAKLLRLGYKVAIAEQVEDPAVAKGLVRREIVQVLTPGCTDDAEALDASEPNYMAVVIEDPMTLHWALVLLDSSSGELRAGMTTRAEAIAYLEQSRPRQIVVRAFELGRWKEELAGIPALQEIYVDVLPEGILRDESQQQALLRNTLGHSTDQLSTHTFLGAAIAAALQYVVDLHQSIRQFLTVRPLVNSEVMTLSSSAVRDLELLETSQRRTLHGSLHWVLRETQTPMGTRKLRDALTHPWTDAQAISRRRELVSALVREDEDRVASWGNRLRAIGDLERLAAKCATFRADARDLGRIRDGLRQSLGLGQDLVAQDRRASQHATVHGLERALAEVQDIRAHLERALVDSPTAVGSGVDVFRSGFDTDLDSLNQVARDGATHLRKYEESLREETGISSLKIREHKSFGFLIEVTRTHAAKVPPSFVRRQTMTNADRFVTDELVELGRLSQEAGDRALEREQKLFAALQQVVAEHVVKIQDLSRILAEFDLALSLAVVAKREQWCEPETSPDHEQLILVHGRHPVIERLVGRSRFTSNSISFAPDRRTYLITGPNMAGKSTVMRQVALSAILHQIGSWVPAQAARLPIFDGIFTRVGAADDLAMGKSTFMVEMSETAQILREATGQSLVILDEVGRGTSTQDGMSLAAAILEDLVLRVKPMTMFATHYHELVPLARSLEGVQLATIEVLESEGKIVFTHRLVEGAARGSYGLEVARLAGVPQHVIERARSIVGNSTGASTCNLQGLETSMDPR